jgi:hypothetical protein
MIHGFLFLIAAVIFVAWMVQMLRLTRQNRIINAMILKVLLRKMEEDKIKIDINEIQNEVLKNL